jgi:DNA-binding MarR family transcriptional regulator
MLYLTSDSFKYEEELKKIQRRLTNRKSLEKTKKPRNVDEKTPLGRNQKIILEIFQRKNHPLFLVDLLPLTAISIKSVDSSLKRLVERGFLSRKEEINEKYSKYIQQKKQFLYNLTEKGKELLSIKLKSLTKNYPIEQAIKI